jgi:hypothetical protein
MTFTASVPRGIALAVVALLLCALASSPPAAADDSDAKREARALLKEGVRLLDAGQPEEALALFRSAHARFASAKLLLNIASTLKRLGRNVEAADTYQDYLDAADTDPARRGEVERVLAELDRRLVVATIATDPADAEVRLDDGPWLAASRARRRRLAPGRHVIHARHRDLPEAAETVDGAAGDQREVLLTVAAPTPPEPVTEVVAPSPSAPRTIATAERPLFPVAASVGLVADGLGRGAAASVGVVVRTTSHIEARASALVGTRQGGYLGVVGHLGAGAWQPVIGAGVPFLFDDGARVAIRAAGGVAWTPVRRASLVMELGVEQWVNAEADIDATQVVPSLYAVGRL